MSWTEPYLIQYPFKYGPDGRSAEARLGFPRRDEQRPTEWTCSFQVFGLDDDRIRAARGADGLQALVIASDALRKMLDELTNIVVDGVAYEIVFPRYVPFCLGLDLHRKICRLVDAEIEQAYQEIAERRRLNKT